MDKPFIDNKSANALLQARKESQHKRTKTESSFGSDKLTIMNKDL